MIRLHVLLVTIAESMKIQHLIQGSMPTIWIRILFMIIAELVKFQQGIQVLKLVIRLYMLFSNQAESRKI